MYINVKVRKLTPDAVIPRYMTEGSAGFDLTATEDVIIRPHQTVLIPTGLAFEVPPGYELQIRPRSGLSRKTGLRIPNAPGTVDSDYRGEVMVIAHNAAIRLITYTKATALHRALSLRYTGRFSRRCTMRTN